MEKVKFDYAGDVRHLKDVARVTLEFDNCVRMLKALIKLKSNDAIKLVWQLFFLFLFCLFVCLFLFLFCLFVCVCFCFCFTRKNLTHGHSV